MKRLTPLLFSILLFLSVIQQAAAVYDPTIGRWLSRDPLKNAEFKEGPNLYTYVSNNPVNLWDELGLCGPFGDQAGQDAFSNAMMQNMVENNKITQMNATNDMLRPYVNSPAGRAAYGMYQTVSGASSIITGGDGCLSGS